MNDLKERRAQLKRQVNAAAKEEKKLRVKRSRLMKAGVVFVCTLVHVQAANGDARS